VLPGYDRRGGGAPSPPIQDRLGVTVTQ
jgi:hypothetical protein